ncbi:putative ribonuclease H-like domain-containing protein [Tanacetum coccineum]
MEELKFNLLSVSQICDKKHNVLFTDKECLILSPKFKFVDEDLDEAAYGTEIGHVNSRILQVVKGNLVRGLPSKTFKLAHSCLACRKGKQHRASCKKIEERTTREPLELLHMDLFGPVSVERVQDPTYDDIEDQGEMTSSFIVHVPSINAAQNTHSEERTADKDVPLNTFEEEKRRMALKKGKESTNSALTLSTANTPSQSTGNTPTDSDDDVPKDGVFSTNSFDDENTENEEDEAPDYNNMDHTIDVSSTPTFRIHKNHPQNQIIGKHDWLHKGTTREGVDYYEVLCTVARNESDQTLYSICILSWALTDQSDGCQKCILYATSHEEVVYENIHQFRKDPVHPNKVYRVVKALYGLHQAPRAWYERLSTFLLKHGYRRGAIDKTLFIKKDRRDIMLVQVYVDDIIFGSTKSSMVKDFEELMQKEFKMSSMGELTFFLGLQVKQTSAGIFLSQDKYVNDILNKFDFRTIKPASTPIEAHKSLGKDEEGEDVDVHLYRSRLVSSSDLTCLMTRHKVVICLCARFQVTQKVSHLLAVKRSLVTMLGQSRLYDQLRRKVNILEKTGLLEKQKTNNCGYIIYRGRICSSYKLLCSDNESTICIVRNPVLHSKTKHIQIRHHFIRDCYEQRLINVVKVHTDDNVADLLTKGFDLARFNFLVVTIVIENP